MKKTVPFRLPAKPVSPDAWVSAAAESASTPAPEVMKRFTLDVPRSLHTRIKKACADKGEPMADVLRAILEREFSA